MTTVSVKQNDVGVIFTDTLTSAGAAVDLTGATVKFLLKSGSTSLSKTATVVTPASGTVRYTTVSGDLAVAAGYSQEWEVTFSGGSKLTFPSDGYNKVTVLPDLNAA